MASYMPGPLTIKSNDNGRYYATNRGDRESVLPQPSCLEKNDALIVFPKAP
jgi:hypothetical protein